MAQQVTNIKLSKIVAGDNDRTRFNETEIAELASSISEFGLIQPITVRSISGGQYQIIAGERRFRAHQYLSAETIPAIVTDVNDEQASAMMLIENVSRKDLDPIDEAIAYQSRIDGYGWTVKDCAEKAGVSTTRVLFRIKLLKLRPEAQALVRGGNLQIGYAQILANAELDSNFQMLAIQRLRDNNHPTPSWFRRQVNELLEKQSQQNIFNAPLFGMHVDETPAAEEKALPPTPKDTVPPVSGKTKREIIKNHIAFWRNAAGQWDELGKTFKRQECEAAALALESTLLYF